MQSNYLLPVFLIALGLSGLMYKKHLDECLACSKLSVKVLSIIIINDNRHFLKCLLCTRHCAKLISFEPYDNTARKLLYPHFTQGEAE